MRIDILTLFPEMFAPVLGASILKRAVDGGVVQVRVHNLRDWSPDRKHRKVDDRPYGGGPGMVLRPEPFFEAVEDLKERCRVEGVGRRQNRGKQSPTPYTLHPTPHVILLSPRGARLTQAKAQELAVKKWLILLCGHYEGVDERVRLKLAQEELSIGDYVLTCGELPAMVVLDSVVRLLPGSLGDRRSTEEESFSGDLLEYPQYTRPVEYRGIRVPDVLLSGNSSRVAEWREFQALRRTMAERPELVSHGPTNSRA